MRLLFRIAFRNLIRQKRRNTLLGTGIAFGVMVLFMSQSYTKGLSDLLINSFIASVFGHVQVSATEKTHRTVSIIRDKAALLGTIPKALDRVDYCWESVSTLARAVGNGSGALMLVVGVEKNNGAFLRTLTPVDGDPRAFTQERPSPPIILYAPKAEELKVKAGDTINLKLTTIHGQIQSARMTVAAIVKPENVFMTMAGFIPLGTLKGLLGYRPWETARINIVLHRIESPDETAVQADRLHQALAPRPLCFSATLAGPRGQADAMAAGLAPHPELPALFASEFGLPADTAEAFSKDPDAVLIGQGVAEALQEGTSGKLRLRYITKFDGPHTPEAVFTVRGVIQGEAGAYADTVFFNATGLYRFYPAHLPGDAIPIDPADALKHRLAPMPAVVRDKTLLERPADSRQWRALQRTVAKHRPPALLMQITSMKETAEGVLKVESALNLICLLTVAVLFAIILTGSVNALRMTIRERTREIGTVRSIGMQKHHVVRLFVMETGLLALFAALAGIALALLAMSLLSQVPFQVDNLFSMLMDKGHLRFMPELTTGLADVLITVAVTVLSAWFPARKAANMSIPEALSRHE